MRFRMHGRRMLDFHAETTGLDPIRSLGCDGVSSLSCTSSRASRAQKSKTIGTSARAFSGVRWGLGAVD